MSVFKYVGSYVKPDNKVDVNVGRYSFVNVSPDTFEIEVPDGSKEESYLNSAIDPFEQTYLYIQHIQQ